MCGRYTYYDTKEILKKFHLEPKKENLQVALSFPDDYNVSPGSEMPVIMRGEQEHELDFMVWGLVPMWSKTPSTKFKLINAKREGLLEKPMWSRLVKSQRCIVPARGFYEWKATPNGKQPYYITPKNGDVFSFAGLWDVWSDERGTKLKTYTIITTNPNKEMSEVHNRMPAILDDKQAEIWLSVLPEGISEELLDDLVGPAPDGSLNLVRVSTAVNNSRNHSEELIYELDEKE